MRSYTQAAAILKEFRPDVVIGVGGYASAPLLFNAQMRGIPTLIQEQNSYAGLTNKVLSKRAKRICVAYPGMEAYFPADKLVLTGNPVRKDMVDIAQKREEAQTYFNLDPNKPVILSVGGSLGARTINQALHARLSDFLEADVQLIWQTGKAYAEIAGGLSGHNIHVAPFIQRMDLAYAAADVIISRAGALSISELCLIGKPCILVPSPNVAEDHQRKNAMVLVNAGAAVMVGDAEAVQILVQEALTLLRKTALRERLSETIKTLGISDAAERIVNEINKMVDG